MVETLRADKLTKTYGEKVLFKNLDFIINENDRIGLIGTNGSGKSSLLNAISGTDHDFTGNIITSKAYRIGYLQQQPDLPEDMTVMESVFAGKQKVFKIIRHYEDALNDYSNHPDNQEFERRYLAAEAKMNEGDAWNTESRVKTILTQLKITNMDQKIGTMSGGQQKRVGLAQVLIQSPNLLLLDEPTNHLDFDSIDWLEQYLSSYKGSLIVVTHDRYFLDQVSNHIWELSFGSLYEYPGNYQTYVAKKAELVDEQLATSHKEQQLYKQELKWMKTGAKARSTKQNARIERFNQLEDKVKEGTPLDGELDIAMGQQRLGKKVIEINHVSLEIANKPILRDFSMLIQNGQRIGISGENGAGKSSLLNAIAGILPIQSGSIEIGETVKMAYYTQQMETIPEDKRVISYLTDIGQNIVDADGNKISVTNLLEQFLFPKFMHGTLIRKLSGGEKRRLYLLKLLMEQPNVLLLDEPTNNLDIATLTVLEDYIKHFNGTTITVSHDRYFLNKVADRLLIFEGNTKIERYNGIFTDYLSSKKEKKVRNETKVKSDNKVEARSNSTKKKTKLTYAEKIEFDGIEAKIEKNENEIKKVTEEMQNNGEDYNKLAELQRKLDDLNKESDDLVARWEYLSEFAE
ncbi:ABC-F family ATP-binding cassette domain-containing protein [Fructilactobacillus sanfranciscensis]|uniref:ABC transporter ATP-binding protein n=1 Tax=Fructilactobacillus sanfranciscensis TaxID=1625 RepID=A0A5C4TLY7_FRUSA|nr:ABC-F family ATP-binding cassette domain-containing protein [Fructilactobacillus sanfranciscensis]NDR69535.1 ABC transporter ATP-binding protein [Fructilactobacillus sanfranciscensis]NDS16250.1 ABC transporter ATP-binding protein [Fructilactobacillus sanfranciscensis]POH15662.1 multidrug ABC transporter ATP-binding protein [Fructilactobacillus sanfranciscensis]POH19841.1 multidrug ABC transporter ATP-binding protein [Fructilactobacillus sanfranciscensis]TNK90886.1 ABC transporter ATP-bindin